MPSKLTPTPTMPDSREVASLPPLPELLWQSLFFDVQQCLVYEDSKTFVDLLPLEEPETILERYRELRTNLDCSDGKLLEFIETHFHHVEAEASVEPPVHHQDVTAHIDALWNVLTRQPQPRRSPWSSRLPLPYAYVVPGGRFNEIYYWDSYFTMLGLATSQRLDLIRDMLNNIAYMIGAYGHMPNGNRTYYLSRSQPPFFACMVELMAGLEGQEVYAKYLPQLETEYAYWMDGSDQLRPHEAYRRVLRTHDGALLNRYWDDLNTPREEAFREDIATAQASDREHIEVWRNIRAGGESGWDFSSRWLADGSTLSTIRTVEIAPVDLNCLMYHFERILAHAHALQEHHDRAHFYRERAQQRAVEIRQRFWDSAARRFGDYLWHDLRLTDCISAAMVYPLYFNIATQGQADGVADIIRGTLLKRGGLVCSSGESGQQWDAPNGWAPLQWMAVQGLKHYGHHELAHDIAHRWITTNLTHFTREHKLIEKYNVVDLGPPGDGEYPAQDGFGWTNGVLRALLAQYPPECAAQLQSKAAEIALGETPGA
ncbi:alpha,alpha-trehalase TreF [Kushneria phosphatilytica]|uniref:alpha,alpha-trehalase TreF n=1 Tax=Kushneria phosphatilytica TaxID=657387 RepID=UPI0009FCD64E|nr:alpha,alpha-trehalase TreF [Kushneria phosphatilytica]